MTEENTPAETELEYHEAPEAPKFQVGDYLWINGNSGKYVGEVIKIFPSLAAAEEAYERSFSTITKVGPLYDANLTHYQCQLANHSKADIGACEADAELKWRDES